MLWGHEYDGIMTFARRSARMWMKGCTIQLRRESCGPMVRHRGTQWNDPDKFIEICANEAEKAIGTAYADFTRKATAFRKKWGTEGMDIDLYVGNCYFYYKPRTDTTTNVLHI